MQCFLLSKPSSYLRFLGATKLGSRVPAMVTFGCLHGINDPIGSQGEPCPYPSHGPELERWALLLWVAGGYLSRLGRTVRVAIACGTRAYDLVA